MIIYTDAAIPVELVRDELDTMRKAYEIVNEICGTMEKHDCNKLIVPRETDWTYYLDDIDNALGFLECLTFYGDNLMMLTASS